MTDVKYIDKDDALSRVGGNESLYMKLLGKFEGSVDMQGFDAAIASKDFKAAGDIAHAAKGVAGNLSLTVFFDQSIVVMDQLRSGEYNEEDVKKFKQLFEETKNAINQMIG